MTKSFLPTALGLFLVPMTLSACVTEEVTFYGNEHTTTVSSGTCEAANSCLAPAYRAEDATWEGADCIAMADNAGATHAQLRVSQLAVESPAVLTQPFMQTTIITEGITPTRPDSACRQQGTNRFNILLDFDFETMQMKVGAAIPQKLLGHNIGEGTCWANYVDTDQSDLKSKIFPVSTTFTLNESTGEFSATFPKPAEGEQNVMNVPIYVADTEDDFALLPLRELVVTGTLSAGNSCVGKFVHEPLAAPTCAADSSGFRWENAGKYIGYVTVDDADSVDVSSLGFSLCTLLSGDSVKWDNNADGIGRCVNSAGFKANSNQLPEGNWCSVSNSADASACDGVLDAWQLKTEFAASGIKIDGDCPQGG